ncbi:MAG: response regulator transcription factor [Planctomycetes bacterium]|nr:response regulator transcription factor [Planctomycetota bacterium]
MRVLVIEDYKPLRESLKQALSEEGFAVDASGDGTEGLWYATSNPYDVVILDLMLPGIGGLEILQQMRAKEVGTNVLILTARDAVADRVQGLDAGADDYLVKPFSMDELMSRVRALVRRSYGRKDPVIRIGDVEVDTANRSVRRDGQHIDLTAREYALLEYLAMREGEVVSRTEIWEHVYDFHSDATSNVVDVYIGYLRKKLDDGKHKLIHTRRGQGYVLREDA